MCGINGIFHDEPRTDISAATVARMNDRLAHRGPNNAGVYESSNVILGNRRLSIIDLSDAGNQPISTPDGRYTIVYNGELYNYREVRKELAGYDFRSNADTEVVLAAFAEWGPECLHAFNGMFAFAIWDKAEGKLFIARDRLGIKPLYYYKSDGLLVFSSEIRALLESGLVPRRLNHRSLADYLRFQTVHAPQTIIDDVHMLMPGHSMESGRDHFKIVQYWTLNGQLDPEVSRLSYDETKEGVKQRLYAAVERRLVADVPFGAFLSGGVDSSAIVGIMSEVGHHKVQTFSVVFEEEEFSEAKYARIIAEKFATEHHEIQLSPQHFLDTIPDALRAMDHPSGDGPNTYVVSRATKEAGVTMALSGLGGDELFAGYPIFNRAYELTNKKWLLGVPVALRRLGGSLLKALRPGPGSDKIHETLKLSRFDVADTYPMSRQVMMDSVVSELLKGESLPPNRVAEIAEGLTSRGSNGFAFPSLTHVSFNEIGTYMQNVLLRDSDQMSMASALEVRVPFLDHELAEFVFSIPDEYKYPHSPKRLLVDSLGDLLPRAIVDRPKMGFILPWEHWLKHEMRDFAEGHLKALAGRGVLDGHAIDRIWNRFLAGDSRFGWARLWPLIVLENWMDEHHVEV